jgi:hypothetical protein
MSDLSYLIKSLKESSKKHKKNKYNRNYKVPTVWTIDFAKELLSSATESEGLEILHSNHKDETYDFFDFHLEACGYLNDLPEESFRLNRNNLKESSCYNMFIRYATAYDHGSETGLYNNTGTLLKAISLLPLIKAIGFNHIHLLPVTPIGKHDRKGNLGSPYAIKNPMAIDQNLVEPSIDIDAEELFKIFIDTCHKIGISVSTEFIFRTASVDSDLALDNPEWFYWLRNKVKNREAGSDSDAKYGKPNYIKRDLAKIKQKVSESDFKNSIKPKEKYREMFAPVPQKIARVESKIVGFLDKKNTVRVPHVFSDWPPDDIQPEWSDVTYFKLYDHPDFNYIAYDTIRMYDDKLTKNENINSQLWDYISSILPYWIKEYSLDGALLDMAHALPEALLDKIKEEVDSTDEDFFFMGEYFGHNATTDKYFDGIVGNLCLQNNIPENYTDIYKSHLEKSNGIMFLSSENHNTRRISEFADRDYAVMMLILNSLLPGVYYILNGTEVYDSKPMNTGLGFEPDELTNYPSEELSLFSDKSIDWNHLPTSIRMIRDMIAIRNSFIGQDGLSYELIQSEDQHIHFKIYGASGEQLLEVAANPTEDQWILGNIPGNIKYGWNYTLNHSNQITLDKYGVVIIN